MEQPKISVIIPVYNVEGYLRSCLDSVMGQTHKNLEILLVDDGSTDGSGLICDEYGERDARVTVIHRENGGVSSARNVGLEAASGEWIGFVDADDRIEPDMFSYLLELADRYGADIAQCGMFLEEEGSASELFCGSAPWVLSRGVRCFTAQDWSRLSNSTCNKLYRAEIIQDIFYDREYPVGEDLLFNVQVLLRASAVALGEKPKYHYIQRGDSACHVAPTLRRLQSYRQILIEIMSLFKESTDAWEHFNRERFRNNLDICSKIVRFYRAEFEPLKEQVREELRSGLRWSLCQKEFAVKERLKIILVACNWDLYKKCLLCFKRMGE